MNDYRPSTPRVAFGIASVAMTAGTFGLFVLAPAMMESGGDSPATHAAIAPSPLVKEAVVLPTRIEVHGTRETTLASAPAVTPADQSRSTEAIGTEVPRIYPVNATASGPVMSAEGVSSEKHLPPKR